MDITKREVKWFVWNYVCYKIYNTQVSLRHFDRKDSDRTHNCFSSIQKNTLVCVLVIIC